MKTEREQKLEWLSRGRALRLHLIGLYAERQERLSRAEYAGVRFEGNHTTPHGNAAERRLEALETVEEEIRETELALERVEEEVRTAIAEIHTPIYQTYLRMRFLGYPSEREIAAQTKYSLQYIDSHVRKKAVDAIRMPANDG